MVPNTVFTRLPTGHGHGEDDGAFAVIKKALKGTTMHTWDSMRRIVEDKLGNSKLQVQLEDVFTISDYTSFLDNCFEVPHNCHKLSETQHQWYFQRVPVTAHFPFGVQTKYRELAAQSSVACKMLYNKSMGLSPLARLTGLFFTEHRISWYPEANPNDGS